MEKNKANYRIVGKNQGYYPQVGKTYLKLFKKWYRISRHPEDQFGLYEESDDSYPDTFENCMKVILDYNKWIKKEQKNNITYIRL